jgi:adenylate cyclase class IV
VRNIELKARAADLRAADGAARELCGCGPRAVMRQIDTYFVVPSGRLKLRRIEGENAQPSAELVYYERADEPGPKRCDYQIASVADPVALERTLTAALGARVVVDKRRTLYVWKDVRIHLDIVEGLGRFLEFEAVMPEGAADAEGRALVNGLMARFSIRDEDLVESSYADLMARKTRG